MKNNILKLIKNKYLIGGILIVLVSITIMTSYSYFAKSTGDAYTEIEAGFENIPSIFLSNTGDINLELNSSTFGVGATNIVNEISSTVTLKVVYNDVYTTTYNGYIELESEFVYSNGETPEILLQITNPSGDDIKQLDNLNYVEDVNGVSGFDITCENGKIKLFENIELSTSSLITDTWNFSIILIAHEYDQSPNLGANFSAKINLEVLDDETIVEDMQN